MGGDYHNRALVGRMPTAWLYLVILTFLAEPQVTQPTAAASAAAAGGGGELVTRSGNILSTLWICNYTSGPGYEAICSDVCLSVVLYNPLQYLNNSFLWTFSH